MEFRSHLGEPVRLALDSGHITIVGAEWRELPEIFHRAATLAGCQRRDQAPPPDEIKRPAGSEVVDHDTAYRAAIKTMLERNEDGDFTAASLPNINVVSKLCGFTARKEDVLETFRAMKAEAEVPTGDAT